jgi:hypothetical protein
MKVKYAGTLPDGYVVDQNISYPFKAGIPIEVPDELGERLTTRQRTIWKKASEEKMKKEEKVNG